MATQTTSLSLPYAAVPPLQSSTLEQVIAYYNGLLRTVFDLLDTAHAARFQAGTPATLTAALTGLTHTAPGTPDYAIQNLTQTLPFGFVTADEGNSVLKVIANLQTRVGELEAKLQALAIVA